MYISFVSGYKLLVRSAVLFVYLCVIALELFVLTTFIHTFFSGHHRNGEKKTILTNSVKPEMEKKRYFLVLEESYVALYATD